MYQYNVIQKKRAIEMSGKPSSKMINMDTWAHFDYFQANGISENRKFGTSDKCYVGQIGCRKTGLISENWEPEFLKRKFMAWPHEKEMLIFIISCGYIYK